MSSSKFADLEDVVSGTRALRNGNTLAEQRLLERQDFGAPDVYETSPASPRRRGGRRGDYSESSDEDDEDEDDDSGGDVAGRGKRGARDRGKKSPQAEANPDIERVPIDADKAMERFRDATGLDGRGVGWYSTTFFGLDFTSKLTSQSVRLLAGHSPQTEKGALLPSPLDGHRSNEVRARVWQWLPCHVGRREWRRRLP